MVGGGGKRREEGGRAFGKEGGKERGKEEEGREESSICWKRRSLWEELRKTGSKQNSLSLNVKRPACFCFVSASIKLVGMEEPGW